MAQKYKVVKDNRENGTKLWYGKAVYNETIGMDTLANRIQQNCSMKKSDVQAVLTELVEVMNEELQSSNKVHLDGLGYFYLSLRTVGAAAEKDFTVADNVKRIRVRFLAEGKKSIGGGITRTFTDGIKLQRV